MKIYHTFEPADPAVHGDYVATINDELMLKSLEVFKWRLHFELRGLEHEIEDEGGSILIQRLPSGNYLFTCQGFTEALASRIYQIIETVKFERPFPILDSWQPPDQ